MESKTTDTVIKTAIVILNWNTKNHLETFLPFLIKYSTLPDVQIVVADNASTDNSVDFIRANYPSIKIIELDQNYGFAEGYNRALKQVDAEYYILLNSDIEVTENWIPPLIQLLDENEQIAACAPKLLSYYHRNEFEYAGAAGGFIDWLGYPFCKGRIFDSNEQDLGQYDGSHPIFWATGACIVVKSKLFHQFGGFDSFLFAHQEEIDFCWRLQNAGYKIYCTSNSSAYHLGGGTLPKSNPRKTYLNFRNNHILLFKNLPTSYWLKIIFLRLVLDGVAAIQFLLQRKVHDFWAVAKAHFSFYAYVLTHRHYFNFSQKRSFPLKHTKSIVYQYYIQKKKRFSEL